MRKNITHLLFGFFALFTFVSISQAQNSVIFKVNSPATITNTYAEGVGFTSSRSTSLAPADRWGLNMAIGQEVTGDVVVMKDGETVDTTAQHGCNLPLKTGVDVRGKVALIRRGSCGFSIKAYNAWKNGAIAVIIYNNIPNTGLFYMLPTRPQADSVNIPCIFTSRETGEAIRNAVQGGQNVNVTFNVPNILLPHGNFNLAVPTKESRDLNGYIGVGIGNSTTTDKLGVVMTAIVEEPDGKKITLRGSADTIKANASVFVLSDSTYRPTKIGNYKVLYKNSLSIDSLRDSFRITDFVFAEDRGTINNWVVADSASFVAGGLKLDIGHIYYTGVSQDKATHAAFAIHNPSDFPKNDEFVVVLYPYTSAIESKFDAQTLTYDDLNGTELTSQVYKIKGTEKADSLIFVEFSAPVALPDNSSFLLMIRYDGTFAGTGKSPRFNAAGNYDNRLLNTDAVYAYSTTAQRYVFFSGWTGNIKNVARLYTQGFRTSLDNNLPVWADNTINLFPNPIGNGILNIDFKLEKLNKEVIIYVNDLMGRIVKTVTLKNVQNGTHQINISELTSGNYFAKIVGEEGWRTKVFHVEK